ncbi:MAG: phosphoesterase [Clostridiales bacterium]|nr:MAG: phosphoesterase [Clostridiales bacterium]
MKKCEIKTYSKIQIFILIIIFLAVNSVIFYFEPIYALISALPCLFFVLFFIKTQLKYKKIVDNKLANINEIVSDAAKYLNLNLPISMIIVDEEGKIVWYNSMMKEIVEDDINKILQVEKLFPDLDFEKLKSYYTKNHSDKDIIEYADNTNKQEIKVNTRYFDIKSCRYKQSQNDNRFYYAIYFYELTLYKDFEKKYSTERPVVAYIEVDNYDDIMNEIPEDTRPFMSSEIEKAIRSWATRMNSIIKKYEKDKYMLIVSYGFFENIASKRFSVLDEVRGINILANTNPTISIGVCADEFSFGQMEKEAIHALEIALGRGGDQAVVRKNSEYEFYGGKSEAVAKRNRVKARIIANAFKSILDESKNVYIMGHQYPDTDAFGSAIGVYKACLDRNKKAKIVLKEPNETIISVYKTFENDDRYVFIRPEDALMEMNFNKDLLVVVDTHRPSFTECPELVEKATRKILIDHHRRGVEFIEDTLLTYLEPYASSACELVTEVLQYMQTKMTLTVKEANAMLAGIVVDTKNFSAKTGVRTFESASVLKKFGADTTTVKEFLQDDIDSFVQRSSIISNSRIIHNNIAISIVDKNITYARLIAAQAADEMLNIKGIKASFVVVKCNENIFVSARSLKEINVQVILERLGGGGHRGAAGVQFKDKSIKEVEMLLMKEIDKYVKEA